MQFDVMCEVGDGNWSSKNSARVLAAPGDSGCSGGAAAVVGPQRRPRAPAGAAQGTVAGGAEERRCGPLARPSGAERRAAPLRAAGRARRWRGAARAASTAAGGRRRRRRAAVALAAVAGALATATAGVVALHALAGAWVPREPAGVAAAVAEEFIARVGGDMAESSRADGTAAGNARAALPRAAARGRTCDDQERSRIRRSLHIEKTPLEVERCLSSLNGTRFKAMDRCAISFKTRCPDPDWVDALRRTPPEGPERPRAGGGAPRARRLMGAAGATARPPVVVVHVGCNKGYEAVDTLRATTSDPVFDRAAWLKALSGSDTATGVMRGACGQHQVPLQARLSSADVARAPLVDAEVHCIEPMPVTFDALVKASESLGYDKRGLRVSNVAIADEPGTVKFPAPVAGASAQSLLGLETVTAGTCEQVVAAMNEEAGADKLFECRHVKMRTLDEYVDNEVEKGPIIDMLVIDTEGFDPLVLRGAKSTLSRVRYLEFEYHGIGPWAETKLADVIGSLDDAGFDCYWAGRKKLWRITGCFDPRYYEFHFCSNIACVHRSQRGWHAVMEAEANETLSVYGDA